MERKKRGFFYYFIRFPLVVLIVVVNIVVVSWIIHIVYSVFSDSLHHMSLLEWADHLYSLLRSFIYRIIDFF